MDPTYEKVDNKLVEVKPVTSEFSLEDLLRKKSTLEELITNVTASRDAELATYQANLDETNALIAKAHELDVKPAPPTDPDPAPENVPGHFETDPKPAVNP